LGLVNRCLDAVAFELLLLMINFLDRTAIAFSGKCPILISRVTVSHSTMISFSSAYPNADLMTTAQLELAPNGGAKTFVSAAGKRFKTGTGITELHPFFAIFIAFE
jgi:hypothetical protein